jgi:hypothetical protein
VGQAHVARKNDNAERETAHPGFVNRQLSLVCVARDGNNKLRESVKCLEKIHELFRSE